MSISAILVTRNSSANLHRTLKSIKDFDEVIICDMKSSDDTAEIAISHGVTLLSYPSSNKEDMNEAYAFAIANATGKWILLVKSDEIVPKALYDYLREIEKNPPEYNGLYIPRKSYIFHRLIKGSYPDYQLRFFRKEKISTMGNVNSGPHVEGETHKIPAKRDDLALSKVSISVKDDIGLLNVWTDEEAKLREGQYFSLFQMMFTTVGTFFSTYILKGAWRYGRSGYIQASREAFTKLIIMAKVCESHRLNRKMQRLIGDNEDKN